MKPAPRIAIAVVAAVLGSAAVAAPAVAARPSSGGDEQDLEISAAGCDAGYQASGLYNNLSTDKVSFSYDAASNSITATCTFRGIPGKVNATKTADGSEAWYRPEAGTTRDVDPCGLFGPEYESHPNFDFDHGLGAVASGTLTYTKGGTVVTTCTFDLDA